MHYECIRKGICAIQVSANGKAISKEKVAHLSSIEDTEK
uniref:Uncharacterized protein n=1 Tax=Triticum urartu TaxID=4572 RepID=A0A8R7THT9_TRIUA